PTNTDDYTTATQTVSLTVNLATPTVTISESGGPYTGSPCNSTATVAGVDDDAESTLEGELPTLTYYEGTDTNGTPLTGAPTDPGTYTVVAEFAGSADYEYA